MGARLNGIQEVTGSIPVRSTILVQATPQDFSLRKHNLVQAILAINDLFYLSVPVVASLFLEDVTAWLELHDIRFTPDVKFTGRSGYDHTFDFVVPASRRAPERLIRAVNRPSRDLAESLAFSWVDTALATAVERAINDADPMGLPEGGAHTDEYSPEIGTFLPRVVNAESVDETTAVLHEEFVRWFGNDTAGPRQNLLFARPALVRLSLERSSGIVRHRAADGLHAFGASVNMLAKDSGDER